MDVLFGSEGADARATTDPAIDSAIDSAIKEFKDKNGGKNPSPEELEQYVESKNIFDDIPEAQADDLVK